MKRKREEEADDRSSKMPKLEQPAELKVPVARIKSIQFALVNPYVLRSSGVLIDKPVMNSQRLPVDGGLLDRHMGSSSRIILCGQCGDNYRDCQNHFGYMKLARPIINPLMIKFVFKILHCVCFYCSRLRIKSSPHEYSHFAGLKGCLPMDKFRLIFEASKKIQCCCADKAQFSSEKRIQNRQAKKDGIDLKEALNSLVPTIDINTYKPGEPCNQLQPRLKIEGLNIRALLGDKQQLICDAETVFDIFNNMSDDDVRFLGFDPLRSHPAWTIFHYLPVAPPCVRPPHEEFEGNNCWSVDETTDRYKKLLKLDKDMRKDKFINNPKVEEKRGTMYQRGQADIYREMQSQLSLLLSGEGALNATRNLPTPQEARELLVLRWRVYHDEVLPEEEKKRFDFLETLYVPSVYNPLMRYSRGTSASKAAKTLKSRMVGKAGRERGNKTGKRKDKSSRTVAVCNPCLPPGVIGLSINAAKHLTQHDPFTKYNAHELLSNLRNGAKFYPGATHLVLPDKSVVSLKVLDVTSVRPRLGWVLVRHAQDNDDECHNRNPTLHREGILGMKAKIVPGLTNQTNDSTCPVQNKDFDGDETNQHAPQSLLARAEADQIMGVKSNMLAVKNGRPIIGPIQDTPNATYVLSDVGRLLRWEEATQHLMNCVYFEGSNAELPVVTVYDCTTKKRYVTGLDLVSATVTEFPIYWRKKTGITKQKQDDSPVFPTYYDRGFYHETSSLWMSRGHILFGRMNKERLNDILLTIYKEVGEKEGHDWVFRVQRMANSSLMALGSTFGLHECTPPRPDLIQRVLDVTLKAMNWAYTRADLARADGTELACLIANGCRSRLEQLVVSAKLQQMAADGSRDGFLELVESQAKGKRTNLVQTVASVGQMFDGGNVFLTCSVHLKDKSIAEQNGFVDDNFSGGIPADKFFFQIKSAMDAIGDTAGKVPEIGYIQRRLTKDMEELVVAEDGYSVVHSSGHLVQCSMGDDGFNPARLERTHIPMLKMDDLTFQATYKWTGSTSEDDRDILNEEWFNLVWLREKTRIDLLSICTGAAIDVIQAPTDFSRLVYRFSSSVASSLSSSLLVSPTRAYEMVQTFLNGIQQRSSLQFGQLFWVAVCDWFSSRKIVCQYRWSESTLTQVLAFLERQYELARVQGNDHIGTNMAQRIAEPGTQLTFNTFHFTGSMNVVVTGIPRIKELVDMKPNIRTPYSLLALHPSVERDHAEAIRIADQLPMCKLEHLTLTTTCHAGQTLFRLNKLAMLRAGLTPTLLVVKMKRMMNNTSAWFECGSAVRSVRWSWSHVMDAEWTVTVTIAQDSDLFRYWWRKVFRRWDATQAAIHHKVAPRLTKKFQRITPLFPPESKQHTPDAAYMSQFYKSVSGRMLQWVMSGLSGISSARVVSRPHTYIDPESGALATDKVYAIETAGSNLRGAFYKFAEIDSTRSRSNDILEMWKLFGSHVSMAVTEDEWCSVLQNNVDLRPVKLVARMQHSLGMPIGSNRYGGMRYASAIARMAFEVPADVLMENAMFAAKDPLTSNQARHIIGDLVNIGTGAVTMVTHKDSKQKITPSTYDVPQVENFVHRDVHPRSEDEFQLVFRNECNLWSKMHASRTTQHISNKARDNNILVCSSVADLTNSVREVRAVQLVEQLEMWFNGQQCNTHIPWRPAL